MLVDDWANDKLWVPFNKHRTIEYRLTLACRLALLDTPLLAMRTLRTPVAPLVRPSVSYARHCLIMDSLTIFLLPRLY
jgi:hypothetical protein